jgi:hypothetical protein
MVLMIMVVIVVIGLAGQHEVPSVAIAIQEPVEVALGP